MLKNLKLPTLLLGTVLTLLTPFVAQARPHDDERYEGRHRHRFSIQFGVGPQYGNGYYDRWGYWHPYGYYEPYGPAGYYDRWGYWHPYRY